MQSNFDLIPAIDLKDGKVIRLEKGDFTKAKIYESDPVETAVLFRDCGAKLIHIVDLDGAKSGSGKNLAVIKKIRAVFPHQMEMGGGIRDESKIEQLLDGIVDRVILGTLAITNPNLVEKLVLKFGGNKIIVGLDAREGKLSTHGWLQQGSTQLLDMAKILVEAGVKEFIYTNIANDGMFTGYDLDNAVQIAESLQVNVIVSGGMRNLDDVISARKFSNKGICGAIMGKAWYDGVVTPQALQEYFSNN